LCDAKINTLYLNKEHTHAESRTKPEILDQVQSVLRRHIFLGTSDGVSGIALHINVALYNQPTGRSAGAKSVICGWELQTGRSYGAEKLTT
jgi:hypothetical protein